MNSVVHGELVISIGAFTSGPALTPKGPMSVDGFLGSSGRLSRRQKHE
jgi:hypothetical protein